MISPLCALFLTAWGFFPPAWSATESSTRKSPQEIQANEVRIYMQPDFAGPYKSWPHEPGIRQRLVQELSDPWEGRIASIQLGSDMGVMLFQNKYFMFSGSGYVSFASSVPDIKKAVPGAANYYASLIIYPLRSANPLGILAGNSSLSEFRFFPLPEMASEKDSDLADIRNLTGPIDFIMFFLGSGPDEQFSLTLYADTMFRGDSLELPEAGKANHYQLSDYNFAKKPKSLKMHVGPKLLAGTATVVDIPKDKDISGKWRCSNNRTFEIIQMRLEIICTDLDSGLQGKGILDFDNKVKIIWSGFTGQKQIWSITSRDNEGKPTKMDMGNGLELTRLSSLIEPLKK
jgi:hypothetical protein